MSARLQITSPFAMTASVDVWGFRMEADYEFDPGEPPIWSPIDRAHPGTPPNAQLLALRVGSINIFEMLRNDQIDAIETKILEQEHQ